MVGGGIFAVLGTAAAQAGNTAFLVSERRRPSWLAHRRTGEESAAR
jgi:hypothetical protein